MLVFAFLQLHFESVLLMQFYHIDMLFGPLYIYPKKKKKKKELEYYSPKCVISKHIGVTNLKHTLSAFT